jgi:hypothetical protein
MTEKQKLFDAVDKFAEAMKERLLSKHKQGWSGWDCYDALNLRNRMLLNASHAREHGDKKSLVDTANLAMMVWHKRK